VVAMIFQHRTQYNRSDGVIIESFTEHFLLEDFDNIESNC
jgi:hypothetical protein